MHSLNHHILSCFTGPGAEREAGWKHQTLCGALLRVLIVPDRLDGLPDPDEDLEMFPFGSLWNMDSFG